MSVFYFNRLYKSYGDKSSPSFSLDLKNITFNYPRFIGIIGKSGSGKSTLLNLLAMIDKPDDGQLYFKGQPTSLWKEKDIINFHNQEIGIVFQHYNLLNEHSVLFNIMLPSLIAGESKRKAKRKALSLLEYLRFPKNLYKQKVSNLSGGEKQRVAILRSLVNDPSVIFADEPTGALDEENSAKIMQIFGQISKNRTVIMVSHNEDLLKKYVDELLVIKDGLLYKHYAKEHLEIQEAKPKRKKKNNFAGWTTSIVFKNFQKRFNRNLICILALAFGLLSGLLIIGFSNGSSLSVDNYCSHQFNYGQLKIYKEKKYEVDNSGISITHQTKATKEELTTYNKILNNYYIEPDFSALVPQGISFTYENNDLSNLVYDPIHSFLDSSINTSFLVKGNFPKNDSLNEIVVNTKCYEYLKKEIKREPIGASLRMRFTYENNHFTGDDVNPFIKDIFVYDKTAIIVGVVKEIDYLSTNKVYYSYVSLGEQLLNMPMDNLCKYYDEEITWFSYVEGSGVSEQISSYSNYAFLRNIKLLSDIPKHIDSIDKLVLYSPSYTVQTSMTQLISAASMGLSLFLAIILVGTALILGIVSFSSYCEDKKKCAILNVLGSNNSSIRSIYVFENVLIGLISIAIAFLFCSPLAKVINKIVESSIGLVNVIDVPLKSFMGFNYLLPLIFILSTLLICIFSTILPISFGKKISIKEELKDE